MPDKPEWMLSAELKKLPAAFIETLAETDGFTEAQKKVFVDHLDDAEDFRRKRTRAVEIGRRSGEAEADSRRETGADRSSRIARAMAYAAWEFDGKPLSSLAQRSEFGVPDQDVIGSLERGSSPRLLKKARE